MTQLLVSIRNVQEARLALAGGADIVDVKEPARGALGAVDGVELRAIVDAVSRYVPVSAALGELLTESPLIGAADLSGVAYAKVGLAGCALRSNWSELWQARIAHTMSDALPVGVVYADAAAAAAPPAGDVLAAAVSLDAPVVLVDTFGKQAGTLLAHWSLADVADFVEQVQDAGLKVALAGSLDITAIGRLLPLRPDLIAVRGAACRGGRNGPLEQARVRVLARLVKGPTRGAESQVDAERQSADTRR